MRAQTWERESIRKLSNMAARNRRCGEPQRVMDRELDSLGR